MAGDAPYLCDGFPNYTPPYSLLFLFTHLTFASPDAMRVVETFLLHFHAQMGSRYDWRLFAATFKSGGGRVPRVITTVYRAAEAAKMMLPLLLRRTYKTPHA